LKVKLLNPYRDDEDLDFASLINEMNSTNVNGYPWRSPDERTRISERMKFIEKLAYVPEEDRA
jgi:hypothetical protein